MLNLLLFIFSDSERTKQSIVEAARDDDGDRIRAEGGPGLADGHRICAGKRRIRRGPTAARIRSTEI